MALIGIEPIKPSETFVRFITTKGAAELPWTTMANPARVGCRQRLAAGPLARRLPLSRHPSIQGRLAAP